VYNHDYQDHKIAPFNVQENDLIYTSMVVDMMDDCNQRDINCNNQFATTNNFTMFPNDNVTGFTILQIQQALNGATSWNQWKGNMKNGKSTQAIQNIDDLFTNWY
jgi:hypothetical protein